MIHRCFSFMYFLLSICWTFKPRSSIINNEKPEKRITTCEAIRKQVWYGEKHEYKNIRVRKESTGGERATKSETGKKKALR